MREGKWWRDPSAESQRGSNSGGKKHVLKHGSLPGAQGYGKRDAREESIVIPKYATRKSEQREKILKGQKSEEQGLAFLLSSDFGKLLSAEHGVRCLFLGSDTPLTRLLFYLSGEKTPHFPSLYCLRPL